MYTLPTKCIAVYKFGHLKVELEEAQVKIVVMMITVYYSVLQCIYVLYTVKLYYSMYYSQAQIKQLECQLADHGIRYWYHQIFVHQI